MKFLCGECAWQMVFEERQLPGDGTLAAAFKCPSCGRVTALLTNPFETQLVSSLGVVIGGQARAGATPAAAGRHRPGGGPSPLRDGAGVGGAGASGRQRA